MGLPAWLNPKSAEYPHSEVKSNDNNLAMAGQAGGAEAMRLLMAPCTSLSGGEALLKFNVWWLEPELNKHEAPVMKLDRYIPESCSN